VSTSKAVSDAGAQQKLVDGKCPIDDTDVVEMGEPDALDDGTVYWHAWFECLGKPRHTYVAERDREMRATYPLWEGAENA